jgi:dienelactone hydrolase
MKAAMPASALGSFWESLIAENGPLQTIGGLRQDRLQDYMIVFVTCRFAKASLDLKVVFDHDNRISGLWVVPPSSTQSVSSPQPSHTTPSYADAKSFVETDATVGTREWTLPGTLAMPKGSGPFPAVVLVHGSGPQDRDEGIGPNRPFFDLAWGLASKGIAVLRYEKRSKVYPGKMLAAPNLTVKEETIDDAVAAVNLLRRTEGIDAKHIFVLGHSLGGMLCPRIARADPSVCGLVVLAGTARPLEDVVVDQARYLSSLDGTSDVEKARLRAMSAEAAKVKALTPADAAAKTVCLGAPAGYWLDLRDYRPAEMARDLPQPMLILQGGRDYQVTREDLALWRAALEGRRNVRIKIYPALNHLFVAGTGKSTPAEYDKAGHVDTEVIVDIAAWIKAQQ